MVRFLYRFLLDFGLILGALLEPCSPPRGPQDDPRRLPDGPEDVKLAVKYGIPTGLHFFGGGDPPFWHRFWEGFGMVLGSY